MAIHIENAELENGFEEASDYWGLV